MAQAANILQTGGHGDYARAVRQDRALPADAARKRQPEQRASGQRNPVRGRARLQVARTAQALRQVAHDLHAHEPLDEVWRARPDVRGVAEGAGRTHQDRSGLVGLHEHQGSSRRHGRSKKNGPQAIGKSRGGWTTKVHMVAANARTSITFALSPGQAHDAPEGRALLRKLGEAKWPIHLIMDRAYEGDETRQLALDLNFIPVVPPKNNRVNPWEYDRAMYKRRNEIERLFRRLKGFRRIFSRFEKLDVIFIGFILFALIVDGLR